MELVSGLVQRIRRRKKIKAFITQKVGLWFKNYPNYEYGDVWKQYLNQMMNNKGE